LIRLDEINEETHQAYRHALANVYASLDPANPVRFLYLLDGSQHGVDLYFGIISDAAGGDGHEGMINLRGALEGHLPGINFGEEVVGAELLERWQQSTHQGVMLGAPTGQKDEQGSDEQSFQSVDRLVRALQSGVRKGTLSSSRWQLAVIGQPLKREVIRELLDTAYALSSQLAGLVRTSVQSSGNSSRQKSISTGDKRSALYNAKRKIEKAKARVRAKVEHPFRVIKRQFGYTKVRFRGLAKNTAQLVTLFALSNLWMARRHLLAGAGAVRL